MFARLALGVTTTAAGVAGLYARHLHRRVHTDSLTGLPNRAALYQAFEKVQRRAGRGELVGLLLADLDRFKAVNDRFGHRFGNQVLRAVAADLADAVSGDELAVRLHGDEFAILLPRLSEVRDAEGRARVLRRRLASTHVVDGQRVDVSLSIGAAVDTTQVTTLSGLLGHADARMYSDKTARRVTTLPSTPIVPRVRDLPRSAA